MGAFMEYRTEEFTCIREGLTIRGTRYLPDAPGPYPYVVLSHGLMESRNAMRKYAAFFAGLGFAAYVFDFNGGSVRGESDGKQTEMSVLTEVRDLKAVIAHAKGDADIEPEKLILMGASQGGIVSALAAAELREKVRGLILFYPAFCIPDYVREGDIRFAAFDPEKLPKTFQAGKMTLGRVYVSDLMDMNVMEEIAPYRGPVLLVHGDADELVDPSYSKRAYTTYTKDFDAPRKDADLVILPGAGHGFSGKAEEAAKRALRRFLSRRVQVLRADAVYMDMDSKRDGFVSREEWLDYAGSSESAWFSGEVDEAESYAEQQVRMRRILTRQDALSLKGRDYTGKECSVRILLSYDGKKAQVTSVETDSEALKFLNTAAWDAEIFWREEGPLLYLYVKRKDMN